MHYIHDWIAHGSYFRSIPTSPTVLDVQQFALTTLQTPDILIILL